MKHFSADDVERLSPYQDIVDALADAYAGDLVAPQRHHHTITNANGSDATLLLMPAWRAGEAIGIKIVTICPDNAQQHLPAVDGIYFWQDAQTGKALASFDGAALTARRTAGASALATRFLARKDARTHLVVGTGALSSQMIRAHATQRSLKKTYVWGRSLEKAQAIVNAVQDFGVEVEATDDLESAARQSDIISCATLSSEPLILGHWLKPGTHVDLVGAFKPEMRESDDALVKRAVIFCDSKETAPKECGDLVSPLLSGVIAPEAIIGDLHDLATGTHQGRTSNDEITLYKSVGGAIQDYATAALIWRKVSAGEK